MTKVKTPEIIIEESKDSLPTKTEVNYGQGAGMNSCGSCQNFKAPNECAVVKGVVSAAGVSDLFNPIEGADDAAAPIDPAALSDAVFGGAM